MSNPPCTDHNPNSQSSTTSRSPPKYPRPWDKKLRSEFDDVPSNATDESLWYGPWDTALHRLFKDHDGFQIAPQHLKSGHRGEPEWSVWYLIKSGVIPVCIVEVKPYFHLKRPKKHIDAYTQVANRLQELITDDPAITKLYGISVIGERFLIMTMDTRTASITLGLQPLGPQNDYAEVAPTILWRNQVLKRAGFRRLTEMVENIKLLCSPFPSRSIEEIELSSEADEESDTSDVPFN